MIYQGPKTSFTFANATTLVLENKATVKANMTSVVNSASYARKFASGSAADTAEAVAAVTTAGNAAVVPG